MLICENQSLEYDTGQIAVFWDNLGHKHFVQMDCETTLALKYSPNMPP